MEVSLTTRLTSARLVRVRPGVLATIAVVILTVVAGGWKMRTKVPFTRGVPSE